MSPGHGASMAAPGQMVSTASLSFESWRYLTAACSSAFFSSLQDNAPARINATAKLTRNPSLALDMVSLLQFLRTEKLYIRRDSAAQIPYPLFPFPRHDFCS